MLKLIIGDSGSGKTFKMHEKVISRSRKNKVIVIVPEQYSFATERTLQKKLQGIEKQNVEVLSFTRLCHTIFSLYGGAAETKIEDSGRHILMSVALNNIKDELTLYAGYHDKIEFISSMVMTVTELENAGISPLEFKEVADACTSPFSQKLKDIAKIYLSYDFTLSKVELENNEYRKAVELSQINGFFVDCDVFIDGFTAFMAGETDLIKTMIEDAKSVTVCISSDSQTLIDNPADIFLSSKKTILKLKQIATDLNKKVEIEKICEKHRWQSKDLEFLADNFLRTENISTDEIPTNIEVYGAKDRDEEIEYIAAMIGNLTRNEGYRYRDIIAVTRTSSAYNETIRTVFERYNIPVFYDKRNEILKEPLIFTIFAFLLCVSEKNATDSAFSFLKSPYSPFDFSDVCDLENYCYIWGIELRDFYKEFVNNPDGLAGEKDDDKLSLLNKIRQHLVEAINSFKEKTVRTNGEEFAKALYDFLRDFQIKSKYELQIKEIRQKGDLSEAVKQTAVWNAMVQSLEQMALTLNNVRFDLEEMIDLFMVAISASDFGSVPKHLDEISVSDANRVRYNEPKIVFVFGANDSEFPQAIGDNLLLNARERSYLISNNLDIGSETVDTFSDERMYAYNAISAPSEKLFVSHSKQSTVTDGAFPSIIVSEITRIFPSIKVKTQEDINPKLYLHTPQSIRHRYALEFFRNKDVKRSFENLSLDKEFENCIKKAVLEKPDFRVRGKGVSSRLFGKNMRLSATQVEGFYNCSFKYFCERGLRARPRQKAEMSPIHSGTFIHHCLYHLVMDNGKDKLINLKPDEIVSQVEKITDDYIKNELNLDKVKDPRLETLVLRLRNSVVRLVFRIQSEFENTDFYPVNFEAKIGKNEPIEPITITLSNGATLCVEGAIDRIDEFENDGVKYVRVIDYKSGKKEFKLSDISKGLNMQMLLYLFTLCEDEKKVPAGILYMPSGDDYIKATNKDTEETILEKRLKNQCMNGLVLDDPKIIRAMEKNTLGIYIPAKIKNGGEISSDSVASQEDFKEIRKTIENNLREMGTALQDGNFNPTPTSAKNYDACKYCPYIAICKVNQINQNTNIND